MLDFPDTTRPDDINEIAILILGTALLAFSSIRSMVNNPFELSTMVIRRFLSRVSSSNFPHAFESYKPGIKRKSEILLEFFCSGRFHIQGIKIMDDTGKLLIL